MVTLKLSENLARLRKQRKVTQEELAEFLGVTKASVSKWETAQSYPDILLLPVIANYFDISIDDLIGFQAQLSPQQIKKQYADLSQMFAEKEFEEAYKQVCTLVKQYYACYEFILSAAVLMINHYMLAKTQERQKEVLNFIYSLTMHIENDCSDLNIRNDAIVIKTLSLLQLGKAAEAVDILSDFCSPDHMSSNAEDLLTQAFMMNGDIKKAISNTQIILYKHLIEVVTNSIMLLHLETQNREKCEMTISRITTLLDIYDMKNIHPNCYLQFQIQAAIFYASYDEKEKSIEYLKIFTEDFMKLLQTEKLLRGDKYFDCIDDWLENLPLSGQMPRSVKVVYESTISALTGPMFDKLSDMSEFKFLIRQLKDAAQTFDNLKK